jgi:hypothetical protein
MKLIILQNDCNGQVLPISEGIAKTRANLNLARIISRQHDTREPGGHHEYASADTPWVAHALSQCTPVRYGRIASVSAINEATQFAGPQEIPYVPVHNSNLLTGARRSVLNQLRRGLPP